MAAPQAGQKQYVCEKCGHVEWRWPSHNANRIKRCHALIGDPTRETTIESKKCKGLLKPKDKEP